MVRAICGVWLKETFQAFKDLILMLGVNKVVDRVAMANSVRFCSDVLRGEDGHVLRGENGHVLRCWDGHVLRGGNCHMLTLEDGYVLRGEDGQVLRG